MSVGAVSLNIFGSRIYRDILPPLPNRAEISRGLFIVPSADPLGPSNTAYGTNANPLIGPHFTSSLEVLDKLHQANLMAEKELAKSKATSESNETETVNETGTTEETTATTEEVTSETESQTLTSLNKPVQNVSAVDQTINSAPVEQVTTNPILQNTNKISSLFATNSVFNNTVFVSGSNASVDVEESTNFAATNANYNVTFSPEGSQALQSLNNLATIETFQNPDITHLVDGMIPVAAATLADFTTPQNFLFSQPRITDRIIEALRKLTNSRSYGEDYS